MTIHSLAQDAQPFLEYLDDWQDQLPALTIAQAIPEPERTAIVSVDIINGFCYEGPLSSPRVAALVDPIVDLFRKAWATGVRTILLSQDTHEPDAIEFAQFPAHCVRGTSESQPVAAFQALPFFDQMLIQPKNSISTGLNTGFSVWLDSQPHLDTFIVVGDCTDYCVYQLAMHLRLDANARQKKRRVLLPANCVDTYDLPVQAAEEIHAMPHPADLIHAFFLYHMAVNGVEVVKEIK